MTGDPKSAVFQGQEGSGYAQVLGKQPSAFETAEAATRQLVQLKYNRLKDQEKAEDAKKQAFAKMIEFDSIRPEGFGEMSALADEIRTKGIDAAMRGVDIFENPTAPEALEVRQMSDRLKAMQQYESGFDSEYARIKKLIGEDKIDSEHAIKVLDEAIKQPTIQERFKYLTENNATVPNVTLYDGIKAFVPTPVVKQEMKGGKYIYTEAADEDEIMTNAQAFVEQNPRQYEKAKGQGLVENIEEWTEKVAEQIRPLVPKKDKETRIPTGNNMFFGGTQSKTTIAEPVYDPELGGTSKQGDNVIVLSRRVTGGDLPAGTYTLDDGSQALVQPTKFYRRPGGVDSDAQAKYESEKKKLQGEIGAARAELAKVMASATKGSSNERASKKAVAKQIEGDISKKESKLRELKEPRKSPTEKDPWVGVGKKVVQRGADVVKRAKQEMSPEDFAKKYIDGEDQNGDPAFFEIIEGETVEFPLYGAKRETNLGKLRTQTDIDFDKTMPDYAPYQSGGQRTSGAQQGGKVATKAQIKALVGQPNYKGYTFEELIDWYTSQGYKITD
jgi:hypothetical protein